MLRGFLRLLVRVLFRVRVCGLEHFAAAGERVLIDQGYIQPGTEVVVLAGNSPMRGATNLMKVEVFGDA